MPGLRRRSAQRMALLREAYGYRLGNGSGPPACGDLSIQKWFERRELGSLFSPLHEGGTSFSAACSFLWRIQCDALENLARAIGDDISYAFFKGADVTRRYFPEQPIGFMDDIDLLVAEEHAEDLIAVLYSLGYRRLIRDESGHYSRMPYSAITSMEARHYELVPFVLGLNVQVPEHLLQPLARHARDTFGISELGAFVYVKIDVHLKPVLDICADDLLQNAERFQSSSATFSHVADSDYMWLLPGKYYAEVMWHKKTSLRELFYLGHIAKGGRVDWVHALRRARQHGLQEHCLAVHGLINTLWSNVVPATFIHDLAEGTKLNSEIVRSSLTRLF